MIDERTVLLTLGGTLAASMVAIAYLQEPLRRILLDICRKRDRSKFWAASASFLLLAVPLCLELLLIDLGPWGDSSTFCILNQVKWGLLGLVVWIAFLRYVFVRLLAARRLGRLLDRLGDPEGAHVRPLAYGMTAALVGTIAANFFYLTMQFYYFYAFLAFALALPVVFGARARERPG